MQNIRKTKIILFATILCFWFAQYVYIPYQTPYLFSLGTASTLVGIVIGAYGLTQLLLCIPIGIIADIHKRQKTFIFIGALCLTGASVLRILFATPAAFLIANLLSGIASTMWIAFTVLVSSLFKDNEVKKAMGYLVASGSGGILLGFLVGAVINDSLGIIFVFGSSVTAGLLAIIFSIFIKEEIVEKKILRIKNILKEFKSKSLIYYSLFAVLFEGIILSTTLSFTMVFAKKLTNSEFSIGICSTIFIASSIVISLIIGYAKKIKTKNVLIVLLVLLGIYCFLVPIATEIWQLYVLQAVAGISNGGFLPLLMACVMANSNIDNKSAKMGFFQASCSLGMTLGPMLMGVLIGAGGYLLGYWAMAAISILGILILKIFKIDQLKDN